MADGPLNELRSSLDKLLKDGAYSDLTIISGQDEYRVHKAIVCPRSIFFEKACNSPFKEGCTSTISLPEDDPNAVESMIQYLYHLDYQQRHEAELESPENPLDDESVLEVEAPPFVSRAPPSMKPGDALGPKRNETTNFPNLAIHARIYSLGEKYGIQGLKTLSLDKFSREVKYHRNSEDFIHAVKEVFTSTVEEDGGLRDVILGEIVNHPDLLDKEQLQDVVKSCGLCFELMMRLRRSPRAHGGWGFGK